MTAAHFMRAAAFAVMTSLLFARTAYADEDAPSSASPARAEPSTSVTVGLLSLFADVVDVRGEVAATPALGLSLRGAIRVSDVPYQALGGQARAYFAGTFRHGAFAGVDVTYAHGARDGAMDNTVTDSTLAPIGLLASALVGYKLAMPSGLTLDLFAGARVAMIRPKELDATGHGLVAVDEPIVGLLVAFAAGWSF